MAASVERMRAALSPKDYVAQAIRQAGMSVTLGVFIGSALTSGIAVGLVTAYYANERVFGRLRAMLFETVSAARDAALTTREGKALQRALLRSASDEPTSASTLEPSSHDEPADISEPITSFDDPRMSWAKESGEPGQWKLVSQGDQLVIRPTPGRDYWCRTFYTPLLVKTDGQAYVCSVGADAEATLTTAFTLSPAGQFDHAGVIILIDDRTWVKAGIEFVDGVPRLACVVTMDGFSDWSTSAWPVLDGGDQKVSAAVRISKLNPGPQQGACIVFEAAPYSETDAARGQTPAWAMARIAPLRGPIGRPWQMGVTALSPLKQDGCSAHFFSIRLAAKATTVHAAALPKDHGGL